MNKKFGGAIALAVIFVIGVLIVSKMLDKPKILPVYNPIDVSSDLVDSTIQKVNKDHTIAPFELINQLGKKTTDQIVEGKIYVADFFFATCQTICPVMSTQMERVQEAYMKDKSVKILSFSVTPDIDTPEVLKEYADAHHADHQQWIFLTGSKETIYNLARKSYFLAKKSEVGDGDGASGFIHTNNFVLIDAMNRVRGYYDGTNAEEVTKLIEDINWLKIEQNSTN